MALQNFDTPAQGQSVGMGSGLGQGMAPGGDWRATLPGDWTVTVTDPAGGSARDTRSYSPATASSPARRRS